MARFWGTIGNDTLRGGPGDDRLSPLSGNDFVSGGAGDDTITHIGGNDTIEGGPGNDEFNGSGALGSSPATDGSVRFVFSPGDWQNGMGEDTIFSFSSRQDTIDLSGFGARAPTYAQILAVARDLYPNSLTIQAVEIDLGAFGGGPLVLASS